MPPFFHFRIKFYIQIANFCLKIHFCTLNDPHFGSLHQKRSHYFEPTQNDPLFSTKSYTECPLILFSGRHIQGRCHGGGWRAKAPLNVFKKEKEKLRKCGVFSCIKVIKISFSVIFTCSERASIMIWALKWHQLQEVLPPDPHQGVLPPVTPRLLHGPF